MVRAAALHAMTALATLPRSVAAAAAAASAGGAGTNGGSALPGAGDGTIKVRAAELRAAANGDGSLPGGGAAGFEGGSGGEEGAAECTSEWRMQLGAYALRAQRDGSTLVRAQLCRLLRALSPRGAHVPVPSHSLLGTLLGARSPCGTRRRFGAARRSCTTWTPPRRALGTTSTCSGLARGGALPGSPVVISEPSRNRLGAF